MKMIRWATIATLTTMALAGGINAFAEEARVAKTTGQVSFVPDDGDIIVEPPIVDPPIDPIDPIVPGATGPLSIAYAPTIDFGEQVISNQDTIYNMKAEMQSADNGTRKIPYVSFAQVQDRRGSNEGWNLTLSLSPFKSETQNNELRGAKLIFASSELNYSGSETNNAPTPHAPGMTVEADGSLSNILTAPKGKGAGTSSVIWGDQAKLNKQFAEGAKVVENEAIQLFIPGVTAKDAATYTATLTWNLSAAVSISGETVTVR
ncbi:WxL domain-containing protein [Enterococcus sp. AZ109]|uniref:WxL domain-containing protein n=1 Tax=Enterococcus sp. AZ109 TaxID=2774634 RepID=UPI003F686496